MATGEHVVRSITHECHLYSAEYSDILCSGTFTVNSTLHWKTKIRKIQYSTPAYTLKVARQEKNKPLSWKSLLLQYSCVTYTCMNLSHSQRGKCCAGQITGYTCNRQRSMFSKKHSLPLIWESDFSKRPFKIRVLHCLTNKGHCNIHWKSLPNIQLWYHNVELLKSSPINELLQPAKLRSKITHFSNTV